MKNIFIYLSKHPLFLLIGFMISLVSLISSILFFLSSVEKPFLMAKVYEQKTLIFSPYDNTSKMEVFFDGKKLKEEIVATNIEVWNGGKSYIKPHDILSSIKIKVHSNDVRVLEIRTIVTSRPEIKFKVDEKELDNKIINISWGILEKGDGALLQVVHTNSADINFSIEGSIVGQGDVSVKPIVLADNNWFNIFMSILLFLLFMLMFLTFHSECKTSLSKVLLRLIIGIGSIIFLYILLINLYVIFTMSPSVIDYKITRQTGYYQNG